MENAVFFWVKNLMEIWNFCVTVKVLFWTFWGWDIQSFFEPKKLMQRWYLLITEKFLFWTFRWWEIRSFLSQEVYGKTIFYLVFFSFPWYYRSWEIWFFIQCQLNDLETNCFKYAFKLLLLLVSFCLLYLAACKRGRLDRLGRLVEEYAKGKRMK